MAGKVCNGILARHLLVVATSYRPTAGLRTWGRGEIPHKGRLAVLADARPPEYVFLSTFATARAFNLLDKH